MTEARIWPREAPRVRSIANSRTRWATVIEKVLKIRKAPTNSATPAKTSRAICRKLRLSRISLDCLLAFCWPVSTRTLLGAIRSIRWASAAAETPFAAATEIWSKRPTLSVIDCDSGRVSWAMLAPPKEALPSLVRPTRR